jgi:NitT/TauT family transport system permease protein
MSSLSEVDRLETSADRSTEDDVDVQSNVSGGGVRRRIGVVAAQVALIGAFLAAWQWLPTVNALSEWTPVFDRVFVSSPETVATRLHDLLLSRGADAETPIWSYLWSTISASLLGLGIGLGLGAAFGLVLGSSRLTSDILRPFMVAMNATPRIALIPIVMIIFGPTFKASVLVSVMVTFFIAFFNAYEGARTVTPQLIHNATILGASRWQVMRHIRLPYVLAWTIAALPLAATFSLTTVVVGELLIGSPGLGRLLGVATSNADATFTFALVILLTVVALLTVAGADLITKRLLHWWGK